MPEWVFWGLWGIDSRGVALAFVWVCLLLGIALMAVGLRYPQAWYGGILFAAAAWYWLAVRWADRHHAWDSTASE